MTALRKSFCRWSLAAVLIQGGIASAHQPYESSAHARLDGEGLELTVITSLEIAAQLVGEPVVDESTLESLRPRLSETGTALYAVTVDDQSVPPDRVFVAVRNGEAVFSMLYPTARPVKLRFRAAFLDQLPPGYGTTVEVTDDAGSSLSVSPLLKKGAAKDSLSLLVPVSISNHAATEAPAFAPAMALPRVVTVPARDTPGSKPAAWLPFMVVAAALMLFVVSIRLGVPKARN